MRPSSQFTGNLADEAEGHSFESGKHVTEFTLAVNVNNGPDKEGTVEYHSCKLWNREGIVPHLTKGKQLHVEGRWTYDLVNIPGTDKQYKKYYFLVSQLEFGANPRKEEKEQEVSS
jgi:single-stranded DNA-binding protein